MFCHFIISTPSYHYNIQINNLNCDPTNHFLPFTGENEVVLSQYGGVEYGTWLFNAYDKCLRTGHEKVLIWDHCLGHKSCEHQTL